MTFPKMAYPDNPVVASSYSFQIYGGNTFLQTDIYKLIKTHEVRKNGDLMCLLNQNTTQHTQTNKHTQSHTHSQSHNVLSFN